MNPGLPDDQKTEALKALEDAGGNQSLAARSLGMSRSTFRHRVRLARESVHATRKTTPTTMTTDRLLSQVRQLQGELSAAKREQLRCEDVREHILELSSRPLSPPDWTIDITPGTGSIGVPTLFLSDLHWGEVVVPEQVFGVNRYNTEVARQRLRRVGERAVDLLYNHMVRPEYPGLVVLLGGDLVSGDIHEELSITNETPIMPSVLDLLDELVALFRELLRAFNRVCVFSVPGNHSRTTKKIHAKNMALTNYDWLIACLLERAFADDDRIQFVTGDGEELQFRIFHHRYRLTHGFQFRGGQGFVGPFAPISRGDAKKRGAAGTYGQEYDTLVLGHFHSWWAIGNLIVNGSVVGFNEYAMQNDFKFEPPKQGLWLTSPKWGPTITAPVFCSKNRIQEYGDWVSWKN